MANTVRQNIIANINTVLTAASGISYVESNRTTPVKLDDVALPACFIYSGGQVQILTSAEAVIGQETWDWDVIVECYTKTTSPEAMLQIIYNALYASRSRGGYAIRTTLMTVDPLDFDPTGEYQGLILIFRIAYRNTMGTL